MITTILTAVLVSVATAVIGIIGKVVADWSKRAKVSDEADQAGNVRFEAIEALSMGVTTIGVEIVKDLKERAKDGKLSKGEIKAVQEKAIDEAIKIASDPKVIEFLMETAFNTLSAIITSIVQGGKKDKE